MRLRRGWVAAATAACLLGAVVLGWRLNLRSPQPDAASNPPPSTAASEAMILDPTLIDELASDTVDHLSGLIATAVTPQSDELKQGTRLVAETLLDPLPIDVDLIAGP